MKKITIATAIVAATLVGACGGGGGSPVTSGGDESMPDMQPPTEPERAERLPFPYMPSGHFRIAGLPALSAADARHMPIYRDGERLFVGVDQGSRYIDTFTISDTGSPDFSIHRIERDLAAALPVVGERGNVEIRHGRIADGVGEEVVAAYLADASAGLVQRYNTPPEVRIIGDTSPVDVGRIILAIQLANTALPDDAKLSIGAVLPDFSLRHNVGQNGSYYISGEEPDHGIDIEFVRAGEYRRGRNSAAVTWGLPLGRFAYIQINMGANSYSRDHEAITLLAHEIMHALGVDDHVSSEFATIMEGTGAIHHVEQNGVDKPLSLLYPVDREALQALYGRLEPGDDPADFGPWTASTLRIDGNGPHANFGVALRNGYAEPWAYGHLPDMDLAHNRALSGSATWTGTLLGFTPAAAPVAGDAEVGVNLRTMAGHADFANLETWAAHAAPGEVGTGTQWHDGDLAYVIAVRGNTFRETGGDDGRLTGIFTGRQHQGAAGTLERSDLTAAFGASR